MCSHALAGCTPAVIQVSAWKWPTCPQGCLVKPTFRPRQPFLTRRPGVVLASSILCWIGLTRRFVGMQKKPAARRHFFLSPDAGETALSSASAGSNFGEKSLGALAEEVVAIVFDLLGSKVQMTTSELGLLCSTSPKFKPWRELKQLKRKASLKQILKKSPKLEVVETVSGFSVRRAEEGSSTMLKQDTYEPSSTEDSDSAFSSASNEGDDQDDRWNSNMPLWVEWIRPFDEPLGSSPSGLPLYGRVVQSLESLSHDIEKLVSFCWEYSEEGEPKQLAIAHHAALDIGENVTGAKEFAFVINLKSCFVCLVVNTLVVWSAEDVLLKSLVELMSNVGVRKIVHDVVDLSAMMREFYGRDTPDVDKPSNILDSQLLHERLTGSCQASLAEFAAASNVRTLDQKLLKSETPSAVSAAALLEGLANACVDTVSAEDLAKIIDASVNRFSCGKGCFGFDSQNSYLLGSKELLDAFGKSGQDPSIKSLDGPLVVDCSIDQIRKLLPVKVQEYLKDDLEDDTINEIAFDVGKPPQVRIGQFHNKPLPSECTLVKPEDITHATSQLNFGSDDRACLPASLHRISCMKDREGTIYALSMRVGRAVIGVSRILTDALLGCKESILILGRPSSGKTTLLRDIARLLDEARVAVVIIDSSNEIGGDGIETHKGIGNARRMMVPKDSDKYSVMRQAVENHNPGVLIVDEIGKTREEVLVLQSIVRRGVRVIATAHGSLGDVAQDRERDAFLGGSDSVTLGDAAASEDSTTFNKLRRYRGGEPMFGIVVESPMPRRKAANCTEWDIISDPAEAFDNCLKGAPYSVEARSIDRNGDLMIQHLASDR